MLVTARTLWGECIELVEEYQHRLVAACLVEDIGDVLYTLAYPLTLNIPNTPFKIVDIKLAGKTFCHMRFSGPRRAMKQNATLRTDIEVSVGPFFGERIDHAFAKFGLQTLHASHIVEVHLRGRPDEVLVRIISPSGAIPGTPSSAFAVRRSRLLALSMRERFIGSLAHLGPRIVEEVFEDSRALPAADN